MASGSQGKPASARFANGLPGSIAALARQAAGRLTAGHFASSGASSSSSRKQQQQQQQQQQLNQVNMSHTPAPPPHTTDYHSDFAHQQQQVVAQQLAYQPPQQHRQHAGTNGAMQGARQACDERLQPAPAKQRHERHQNQVSEQQQQDAEDAFYADQLRRGQLHQRLQMANQNGAVSHPPPQQQQQQRGRQHVAQHQQATVNKQSQPQAQRANGGQADRPSHQNQNQNQQHQHRHQAVEFARNGPAGGGDDDDGQEGSESTRKKKYLTAKYGAQQMSLIKKRLKIEMWLHERLQELTSRSKALEPDELDELDIDLDQLLDLEDEPTRKQHLRKLLAPLADLERQEIDQFICDVLEQSKLL